MGAETPRNLPPFCSVPHRNALVLCVDTNTNTFIRSTFCHPIMHEQSFGGPAPHRRAHKALRIPLVVLAIQRKGEGEKGEKGGRKGREGRESYARSFQKSALFNRNKKLKFAIAMIAYVNTSVVLKTCRPVLTVVLMF